MSPVFLRGIRTLPVGVRQSQAHNTAWLCAAAERIHRETPAVARRVRTFYERLLDGATIASRQTCVADSQTFDPAAWRLFAPAPDAPWYRPPLERRMELFQTVTRGLAETAFPPDDEPPAAIVQVSCTGYEAPTAVQRLIARRGWGRAASAYHLGHMGCFAAVPAARLAATLAAAGGRVSVLHTELCTPHVALDAVELEQLVIHHLFADGAVRYDLSRERGPAPAFRLVSTFDAILPDSAEAMCWTLGASGFRMTLGREVPRTVAAALPGLVGDALAAQGLHRADVAWWAIHPGGTRIIDGVAAVLELDDPAATAHSREVLRTHGNMSSATIPHIWGALLADEGVRDGDLVVSLAFGPGLTVTGNIMRKEAG